MSHADLDDIEHRHTPDAIAARLEKGPQANYLRDWVFGGIDGAVTTFAIVAGVAGAALSTNVILILGAANLLADGFSMAAGNYSGVKAERDDYERLREMEIRQIKIVLRSSIWVFFDETIQLEAQVTDRGSRCHRCFHPTICFRREWP